MPGKLCGAKLGHFGEKDKRCGRYASNDPKHKGRCSQDNHDKCRYQLENGKRCMKYQADAQDLCDQHQKIDKTKPKVNNKGHETVDVNDLAEKLHHVVIEHDVERRDQDGTVEKVGKRIVIRKKSSSVPHA